MTSLLADSDVAAARKWANYYRSIHLNCLPMRRDRKAPAMRSYTRERDEGFPLDLIPRWWGAGCQVCLGVNWGLCVVDLDGREGIAKWDEWTRDEFVPETWSSSHDAEGRHLWFSLPMGVDVLHRRVLWRPTGPGAPAHCGVELLGDRCLVVAPPSRHPGTGRRYHFDPGHGPSDLTRPAVVPDWVLALPAARPSPSVAILPPVRREIPLLPLRRAVEGRWDRAAVLDAIGDPRPLVASWGLRLAGRDWNAAGWLSCHAVGREDRHPSAMLSRRGGYWEPGVATINVFGLSVLLGVHSDWRDCVNDLGRRYGVPPIKELARVG